MRQRRHDLRGFRISDLCEMRVSLLNVFGVGAIWTPWSQLRDASSMQRMLASVVNFKGKGAPKAIKGGGWSNLSSRRVWIPSMGILCSNFAVRSVNDKLATLIAGDASSDVDCLRLCLGSSIGLTCALTLYLPVAVHASCHVLISASHKSPFLWVVALSRAGARYAN